MAIYPCNFGQHRYSGAQQSVYVTWVNGATASTGKARCCEPHFSELCRLVNALLTPIGDALQSSLVCEECDSPATDHVYATVYARGDESEASAGDFCAAHARAALERLGWANFTRRGA